MRSEGRRQMSEQRPVLFEPLFRTHGILRLRTAPPSPSRRSAQDDRDFDVIALRTTPALQSVAAGLFRRAHLHR